MDDEDPILGSSVPLPTEVELLAWLDAWWCGDLEREALRSSASELVDRAVFPDLPTSDPRAAVVELVLQLASDLPLVRADIPAMRAFVGGGETAWAGWYAYLAGIDWSFRRRHGWQPGR